MKKSIFILIGALLLLTGCQNQQASNVPAKPKWQGAAYHIAFGAQPAKPNPAGITLPPVKWTANPELLQTRADLVVQLDLTDVKKTTSGPDLIIMGATDVPGAEGSLTDDYMSVTDKQLATLLASYCMKGKVKLSVALVPSSLPLGATDDLVNAKRMSDWLPIETVFKNPHPKC